MSKINKKRILLCNEASFLNSGYSNYGREILNRLYKTDKYEIAELACYGKINDSKAKDIPWKYYANSVESTDPRYEKYNSSPLNQFGHWRFDIVCLDFKPNIVFDVRDPWMFDYQSSSPLRKFFHWIVMPAMDSIPQKIEWLTSFGTADILVPYTEWSKEYLKNYKNLYSQTTPAGINTEVFTSKKNRKKEFGIPENSFIIGSVMRNQRRKLIPALFEVIKRIKETHHNVVLYLHTTYPEMSGWNIPSLLLDFGLVDSVYFTYKCKSCKFFYPSKFNGPQSFCKKCGKFESTLSGTMNGISDSELSDIYNMFDIYVQYAICEGFGIPQIEASSCGVPVFSVDYSAMSEVVRNVGGYPIKLSSLSYEIENHAKRAYPDIEYTVKIIKDYIDSSKEFKNSKKEETKLLTQKLYNWDNISKVWEDILDSVEVDSKKNWVSEPQFKLPKNIRINKNLNNFDIVHDICVNVIKDEDLMRTNFIQATLLEMDHGIQKVGNKVLPFTREMALEKLEKYANMKAFIDQLRMDKERIAEDYILEANRNK